MAEYGINDDSPFESDDTAPSEGRGDSGRKFIWKGMSVSELTRHMSDIQACLPPLDIAEVDMERALMLQMHTLRELQAAVIADEKIALNQRVQAASALTKILADITDRQNKVYDSERMKRVERALIRSARNHMDEDACAEFMASYAKILEEEDA